MGITKDVFEILAQNQKVRDAFNKGVDALVDAVTGEKPTLESRKAALLAVVGSLHGIAAQVSDFRAYYAALIGLCFETASVAGRGVLVEDLYARPNRFFFPVPVIDAKLILGQRQTPREEVFGVVDPSGIFQVFYAIDDSSGQAVDIDVLRQELDESAADEKFLDSLRASGRRVNALIGVTEVVSPPGHRYSPHRPEPLGDDSAVPIVRRAGSTRQLLEAALVKHLNSGAI